MTPSTRAILTIFVFAAMMGLVLVRPRQSNEAWWTLSGGAVMLAFGFVSPKEGLDAAFAGKNALLFLLSLLLLSFLVGKSGFFEWAALRGARLARGNAHRLYRNAFVLGALVTFVLSLDTTAVMLTPVVLALVKQLKLPPTPYIVLCAFVANVGSLLLPISNLTNLLFAEAFQLSFGAFAWRMLLPQTISLLVTFALLRWHFRHELPRSFVDVALPQPDSVVPSRTYFIACAVVLVAVLFGYFAAPLIGVEPYMVAFVGCAVLLLAGAKTGRVRLRSVTEISWSVFPFVLGLFVAVRGLDNLGLVTYASNWLQHAAAHSSRALVVVATSTTVAANIMNNLPAALIARSALLAAHAPPATALAALVGADVGPMVTPFGSLATMLVLALARQDGVPVRASRLIGFGLWATPVIVALTTLAVVLTSGLR